MSASRNKKLKVFINATTRLIILSVILLLQIISVALLSYYLHNISILVLILLYAVSALSCVFISAHHDNPSTRVFWLLLIAFFPAFGHELSC